MTEHLVKLHTTDGIRGWFNRLFRSGKLARQLQLAVITTHAINNREMRAAIEKPPMVWRELASLQAKIDIEAQGDYEDSLIVAQESARLLEGARSKSFELVVLATATLFGGVAGAIAAIVTSH